MMTRLSLKRACTLRDEFARSQKFRERQSSQPTPDSSETLCGLGLARRMTRQPYCLAILGVVIERI
jgi:hypothetical protein